MFDIVRPRWGKIPTAIARYSTSRSRLYEIAAENPGFFRKDGKSTLVDLDMGDSIFAGLPIAKIKPPTKKKSGASAPVTA
jgi:hypothetical protein